MDSDDEFDPYTSDAELLGEEALVPVVVNGYYQKVPRFVNDNWGFRGALGVPRGVAVVREDDGEPMHVQGTFEFKHGMRFLFLDYEIWIEEQYNAYFDEEFEGDGDWTKDSDWWKSE